MISVFVVEDEVRILETTLAMLAELNANVVGSAADIDSAFEQILATKPDLLLLDVEVGSQTSFDLLERFTHVDFKVIFITAHQKYALDAFKFSAIDFLLKPLGSGALEIALSKVTSQLEKDQSVEIETLQYNLKAQNKDQKLILKTQDKIHVLRLDDIHHCESDQSYTIFYTSAGKVIVSKTLGYYDDLLSSMGFYRVHKSHLINLKHVLQIHKADGGEVEMTNERLIPISQRKREDFLKKIDNLGLH